MAGKVVTIVGARPQFIKLAPFSREVRKEWREVIVHTGQHYDVNMSGSFFEELEIHQPDRRLDVGGGGHGAQTGRMLEALEKVLIEEEPEVVVVFGDTNSTVAGALAAAKLGIPLAHVEAGLRSFNRSMPEEINRVVADHTSDILFAPTRAAMENLAREGLAQRAVLTGDIMVDAVQGHRERAERRTAILGELDLERGKYSLLTLHRPYTVDNPDVLKSLLDELASLNEAIVFPVHPRTRKTLEAIGEWGSGDEFGRTGKGNFRFIGPVGYLEFLCLQSHARRILTDSGGVQKEAYILRKPCITLRSETEWVETVAEGWNLLLPPGTPDLADRIRRFTVPAGQNPVFGEAVSKKIVKALRSFLPAGELANAQDSNPVQCLESL